MKVTKAQAQANRAHIIGTASELFRERGFDGIGVADLMGAAGFTHGGFYKHFGSKADLMAESIACGLAQTLALSEGVDASTFIRHYLSREHRDGRATGCTMAALGCDTARQPESVRIAFEKGIEQLVPALAKALQESDGAASVQARARTLDVLAHAVGALVMSRACADDSPLAEEFLAVGQESLLASLRPRQPAASRSRRVGVNRAGDEPSS